MTIKRTPSWYDDEVGALFDLARGFFEREVVGQVATWDAQRRIDRSVWLEAGKLGLLLCSIPAEYGGGDGTFAHDLAVFDAQGYAGDLSLGIGVHSGIVPHYLLAYKKRAGSYCHPPVACAQGAAICATKILFNWPAKQLPASDTCCRATSPEAGISACRVCSWRLQRKLGARYHYSELTRRG